MNARWKFISARLANTNNASIWLVPTSVYAGTDMKILVACVKVSLYFLFHRQFPALLKVTRLIYPANHVNVELSRLSLKVKGRNQ